MTFRLLALVIAAFIGFAQLPAPASAGARQLASSQAETIKLPVLRRTIGRHETIAASDITWTETKLRRLPQTALTDPNELIGMAARRRLSAGRPVLARDIQEQMAVRKGDLVAIVYTTPHMTLTARGRALEDAPPGGSVRTLNAHSRRTIEATAIAPGIVATQPISHEQLMEAMR